MTEAPRETLAGRKAVLEGLPDHPAIKALLAWNSDALTDALFDRGELTLTVPVELILEASSAIKAAGYTAFLDMTAVDWLPSEPRFQLSYHILSRQHKQLIRLKTWVNSDNPAVESITSVWAG